MWCHLCKLKFTDQETFKVHIMKQHRSASEFYDDSESETSEPKENEASDDIDESEIDENEKYVMDLNDEDTDNISDDSFSGNSPKIQVTTSRVNTRQRTKKNNTSFSKPISTKFDQDKICSKGIRISKQNFVINSVNNQGTIGSSQMKNQPPMFIYDNETDQLPLPNIRGGFDFNPRNILIWLIKFKEMTRRLTFPIQPRIFKGVVKLHKGIFDSFNTASSNEVTSAVMKVYEELDNIIHRQITSINEQL